MNLSASPRVNPLKKSSPGRELVGKNLAAFSTSIIPQHIENTSRNNAVYDRGRVVGYIRPGGIFHRKMQGSKHILREPRSIAFGVEPLKQAIRAECKTVLVEDTETGLQYSTDIWNFNQHGITIDRGWGPQLALPLEHWKIFDPANPEKQLALQLGGAL